VINILAPVSNIYIPVSFMALEKSLSKNDAVEHIQSCNMAASSDDFNFKTRYDILFLVSSAYICQAIY
jgi:hypothetical protein